MGMSQSFEPHIQKIIPELFSFGFALIPDDLQAGQLVIDALASVSALNKEKLVEITDAKDDELRKIFLSEIKREIYRNMFQIGKRRCDQLRELCQEKNKFQTFYKLSVSKRAILFLKQKAHLSFSEIEFITGIERLEIISRLHVSREELVTQA